MSVRNAFQMSAKEAEAAEKWCDEHVCNVPRWQFWRRKYSFPSFSYVFTPTVIGPAVSVRCHCGANKNVTDYGSW